MKVDSIFEREDCVGVSDVAVKVCPVVFVGVDFLWVVRKILSVCKWLWSFCLVVLCCRS